MKCTDDSATLPKCIERGRVFKFLSGLNSEFDPIRVQVLGKEQLPSLTEVFYTVWGEESRRGVMLNNNGILGNGSALATGNTPKNGLSSGKAGSSSWKSSTKGNRDDRWCTYCKRTNYTQETCFKLHGRDEVLSRLGGLKGPQQRQANHSVSDLDIEDEKVSAPLYGADVSAFSKAELDRLRTLLDFMRLLHDREWLLKSLIGEILTQKKVPEMGFITTLVDLKLGLLIVESPRCKEKLQIELTSGQSIADRKVMEIYSQRYEVQGYSDEIDIWFSNAVGRSCTLVRSYAPQNHTCFRSWSIGMCRDVETKLNFVNEAQFLLITEESIADLNNRLRSRWHNGSNNRPPEVNPSRFRPNLVVSGGKPYAEDGWRSLKIGERNFTSMGGCNRCHMINMTFEAGNVQRSNEPLATLASYRRLKGKICFGILLKLGGSIEQDAWLRVGQEIVANTD